MSTDNKFSIDVDLSTLTDLIGSQNHSVQIPGAEMLGLACNAIDAAVDEIGVLRHSLYSDELDAEKLDLVLWRLAERMRIAGEIAWHHDANVTAVRVKAGGLP